jgi:two-component system KDP operon response regulator KdpE
MVVKTGQRVLVVDDEPETRRLLRSLLADHGYLVELAASGDEALNRAALVRPDLVVLDLMLPDMDGLEICKELREWSTAPIIVLSAKTDERAKVEALNTGADDYLTKPFGLDEFVARVYAALRRATADVPAPILGSGELRLDQTRRQVTRRGEEVRLTPTEYEVLRYLMAHAGKVVTYPTLLRAVWGPGYEAAYETLRVFVANLRRKVEPDPEHPTYIRTEARVGYRFCNGR